MFRNMVTSLFKYESIKTTDAKAKELRRWADRLITLAKRGDLHARRQALAIIREKNIVHKLFEEATEKFGGSAGGYTRITKIGTRPGDAAPVSKIELIITETKETKKTKKSKPEAKEVKAEEPAAPAKEPVEPEADTPSDAEPEKDAE
jgi:large subunit ribosomal protein L17